MGAGVEAMASSLCRLAPPARPPQPAKGTCGRKGGSQSRQPAATRRGGLLSSLASLSAGCGLKMQHDGRRPTGRSHPGRRPATLTSFVLRWLRPEGKWKMKSTPPIIHYPLSIVHYSLQPCSASCAARSHAGRRAARLARRLAGTSAGYGLKPTSPHFPLSVSNSPLRFRLSPPDVPLSIAPPRDCRIKSLPLSGNRHAT